MVFIKKREDRNERLLPLKLIDYSEEDNNIYKIVNQSAIKGYEMHS
jgi:type I restriction enzyme R subunit